MKTLIVEDDGHVRRLLERVAVEHGLDVVSAPDAETGWVAFEERPAQLVLLDLELPAMDGLHLCRRIRAHPRGADALILAVTASRGEAALDEILQAGVDDYLPKPFTPEQLDIRLTIVRRRLEDRVRNAKARGRLNEAWEQVDALVDAAPVAVIRIDDGGTITETRGGVWAAGLGIRDAIVGTSVHDLFGDVPELEAARERPRSLRTRLGGQWVIVRLSPLEGSGRVAVVTGDGRSTTGPMPAVGPKGFAGILGESKVMRRLFREIRDVSVGDWTVLIEGETGSGKELVARAVHTTSPRSRGPFVALNCAGLSATLLQSQLFGHRRGAFTGAVSDHAGVFEVADGGTLLLDEIGDISAEVQMSLLRVLEESRIWRLGDRDSTPVDVRVIAATHRDLSQRVADGAFRADLLYRIRVARIHVPPLRDRGKDVSMLAIHFAEQAARSAGRRAPAFTDEALALIRSYQWPGNVRELRAALEFATIRSRSGPIDVEHLPPELSDAPSARAAELPDDPTERLLAALDEVDGNRAAAARLLGISRTTLYRRLAEVEADD